MSSLGYGAVAGMMLAAAYLIGFTSGLREAPEHYAYRLEKAKLGAEMTRQVYAAASAPEICRQIVALARELDEQPMQWDVGAPSPHD